MLDVVVITGPTASGKTDLSLMLANDLQSEIISADSRQVYKMMDICTAKPSKEELSSVNHHLIDFLNPDGEYSAGIFARDASRVINELSSTGKTPIVCGGSLFYIKALFEGLFDGDSQSTNHELRHQLNKQCEEQGLEPLLTQLQEVDAVSYERVDKNNKQRVIRALEYYLSNNEKLSDAQKREENNNNFRPIYFAIDFPRQLLYDRINRRCEQMWEQGIVEEYKQIIDSCYSPNLNSMNTVGYNEVKKFLEGEWTEGTAIEEFKKFTRRYAKRQLTWLRGMDNVNWLNYDLDNKTKTIKIKECLNI